MFKILTADSHKEIVLHDHSIVAVFHNRTTGTLA